jgi:putative flippase GtrA
MSDSRAWFETRDIRSISRFLVVGMLGTLIDITLFAGLHTWLGVPTLAANTISYSAGIVNNFGLHRYWTFADRARQAASAQFSRFAVVSLSALMLNNLLVLLLAPFFGRLFPTRRLWRSGCQDLRDGCGVGLEFPRQQSVDIPRCGSRIAGASLLKFRDVTVEVNAHDERIKN